MKNIDLQDVIDTRECWVEFYYITQTYATNGDALQALSEMKLGDSFVVSIDDTKVSIFIKKDIANHVSKATWKYFDAEGLDIWDDAQEYIGRHLLAAELEALHKRYANTFLNLARDFIKKSE